MNQRSVKLQIIDTYVNYLLVSSKMAETFFFLVVITLHSVSTFTLYSSYILLQHTDRYFLIASQKA